MVRPNIVKSYFETYIIYDQMQKTIRSIFQKFTGILRFENLQITRFCRTLAYENCHSLVNFLDTKVSAGFIHLFIGSENDVLQPRLYVRGGGVG